MPQKTEFQGLTIARNRHGRMFARWRDPQTGTVKSETFLSHGFTTRAQARGWLKELSRKVLAGKAAGAIVNLNHTKETWVRIEADYLKHFAGEHGALSAKLLERDHLRHWRTFATTQGLRHGSDLSEVNLSAFRSSLDASHKASYRNRIMGAVRAFLGWCSDLKYVVLTRGDLKTFLKPFKVPTGVARVLDAGEIKRLLRAVVEHDSKQHYAGRSSTTAYLTPKDKRDAATGAVKFEPLGPFVMLLLLTGCRVGEALALKPQDVDAERGRLKVWGSKTAKMREVVTDKTSPALWALLRALKLRAGKGAYLLGEWKDGKGNARSIEVHHRQWKRLMSLAGLKGDKKKGVAGVRMKDLRSTCVAHFASANVESEYLLEARFGHSGDVSRRYYRQPLHGIAGSTLEEWFGCAHELRETMTALGFASAPVVKLAKAG